MESDHKALKTLFFKVDEETHRRVRVAAAEAAVSLREWVEDAVNERLDALAFRRREEVDK